jgi:transcriptional regulator GlxA family with amidase domain
MLSGIAAHSMVDRRIGLSRCEAFRELVSIDPSEYTSAQCIDTLQLFLIDRLKNANVNSVVATALAEIDREHGCLPVADIAARCGVSARHLNRLMRLWVGYGPKRYAGIVRFQSTLMQMEHAPEQSVALLASESGYFDQAHLTFDVARLGGATPGHMISHGMSDFSKTRCDDLL